MKSTGNGHAALARKTELIVKELADEVLVYDLKRDKAHCLNLTAAFVWNHCDGQTSAGQIARLMEKEWQTPVSEDAVWFALSKLSKAELLREQIKLPAEKAGISRRSAMRRLALGGLMVPAVLSLVAPTASAGASVPAACQVCIKKGEGGGVTCVQLCQGFMGSCHGDAGCSPAQVCKCVGCVECFTSPVPAKCDGKTVSWVTPGILNCT